MGSQPFKFLLHVPQIGLGTYNSWGRENETAFVHRIFKNLKRVIEKRFTVIVAPDQMSVCAPVNISLKATFQKLNLNVT